MNELPGAVVGNLKNPKKTLNLRNDWEWLTCLRAFGCGFRLRVVLDTTGGKSIVGNVGAGLIVASYRDAGLVLQFTFTPVAEPSTRALLGVVGLVFGARG